MISILPLTCCWTCLRTIRRGQAIVTDYEGKEFCSTGCRKVHEDVSEQEEKTARTAEG